MRVTVKVFLDGNEVFSKIFGEGVYRLGRSDLSDIVLQHESVSRSHLELRVTEAAVYATNMSTAGKVRLNGKPSETAEVADGDEISIGPFKILLFHGERASEEPVPPPLGDAAAGGMDLGAGGDANQIPGMGSSPGVGPKGEPVYNFNGEGGGEGEGGGAVEPPGGRAAAAVLEPPGGFGSAPSPMRDSPVVEGTSALARAETQVELKPVVAKLIFTDGPRAGEEIMLEAFEVTLGRSKKADIFLDDEKLSRVHAKITRVGMGYRLIDLNSRNGTYVNGMRVLEHPLSSFDQIEIGHSKIKFLIHDIVLSDMNRRQAGTLVPLEQTKSFQIDPARAAELIELQRPMSPGPAMDPQMGGGGLGGVGGMQEAPVPYSDRAKSNKVKIAVGILALLLITYLVIPSESDKATPTAGEQKKESLSDVKVPPAMPKEYLELTPESQRAVEGYYNSAVQLAERENFEEAVAYLKKIHEALPYYKNSRELQEQFLKKVKEKQIADAQEKAKRDEKQDLAIYLDEGLEYLKEGDFDKAAEAFNSAIVIDPNNQTAIQGLKAAEYKVRRIEDIPPERDPEQEKRKLVAELFQKAVASFTNKGYQEAIDTAEKIRQIELKGDTQYLNEAKQIIDRARMLQKEEFEPWLIQAKEKFAEGDYNASRDLCEEMSKRDPAYDEAKECVLKARKQLNRLAKEAYTHGYILESMNRIEEAKQYWNRAKNYVRQGDEYYDKVMRKLEYYQ